MTATHNTGLIPAFDTGGTPVLSGLPECPDGGIWRDAIRLRMSTVGLSDRAMLERLIASLDGPTIYDELVAERGGVR